MTERIIDVIYLTKDLDEAALGRFKNSVLSLKRSDIKPRLIVSDTSEFLSFGETPLRATLESCEVPYRILHENNGGVFNRSRTINNGVRAVTTSPFIVMDIDIVAPKGFLDELVSKHEAKGSTYMLGWIGYLAPNHKSTHIFEDITDPVDREYHSGYFICEHGLFVSVNGFDEDYIGWGGEDEDFTARVSVKTGGRIHKLRGDSLMCLHQYHKSRYQSSYSTFNRERYFTKKELYESGKLRVDQIKGMEDRSL